jgi:hypothetical protein
LHQAWTDYRKTVTFESYDVTKWLTPGPHVLAVMLGNGMYNAQKTKGRYTKFEGSFGVPRLIAELRVQYAGGKTQTIGSDATWKAAKGPVVFSSTYGGEDFDARKQEIGWDRPGFADAAWAAAKETDGPGGMLIPAIAPEVREGDFHAPVKTTQPKPAATVYDLGELRGRALCACGGTCGRGAEADAGRVAESRWVGVAAKFGWPDVVELHAPRRRGPGDVVAAVWLLRLPLSAGRVGGRAGREGGFSFRDGVALGLAGDGQL